MDDAILITELNDFIFCPASIYFHKLYGNMDVMLYQSSDQLNGTAAHEHVDNKTYSTRENVLMGTDVYCDEFHLIGKIDIYEKNTCTLRERKKKVNQIFDGYVFQVYAQCLALREMGYEVNKIIIYSIDDNKSYLIPLPEEDEIMYQKFVNNIENIRNFKLDTFCQTNLKKCQKCIYEPSCDRALA